MANLQPAVRSAYYAVLALPVAFAPTGVRARVTRRTLRVPFASNSPGWFRAAVHSLLSAAIGLVAWFAVFLALVAAVRGIAYPLVAADGYEHSWGGPTLAGAWVVHALLGVGLLPLWFLLLAGIGMLQRQLARRLLARTGPWWPVPVAAVAFLGAIAFFIAWLHQI